jgi:hypothetical protein
VCFEIANDNEAPESWLEWPFTWRKVVFGFSAHRRWHYTGPDGQPTRHVKWFIRSIGAPLPETIMNLWASLEAWVMRTEPPWIIEAREAAEEEEDAASQEEEEEDGKAAAEGVVDTTAAARMSVNKFDDDKDEKAQDDEEAASESSSVRSARALSRHKRIMTATGLIGTYLCWAIFSWCAACCIYVGLARALPLLRACAMRCKKTRRLTPYYSCVCRERCRFIFTCAFTLRACGCLACQPARMMLMPRVRAPFLPAAAQTACSSISCWATARSRNLQSPSASRMAWALRLSGRRVPCASAQGLEDDCCTVLACSSNATACPPAPARRTSSWRR